MTTATSTGERGEGPAQTSDPEPALSERADPAADTSALAAWYDRQRAWVKVTLWAGLAALPVLTPRLYWTLTDGHPMFLHGYL